MLHFFGFFDYDTYADKYLLWKIYDIRNFLVKAFYRFVIPKRSIVFLKVLSCEIFGCLDSRDFNRFLRHESKVAYLERLYGEKIIRIQAIEIRHLGQWVPYL
jgi:hypothetical protein